jgi:hypothetical protein
MDDKSGWYAFIAVAKLELQTSYFYRLPEKRNHGAIRGLQPA